MKVHVYSDKIDCSIEFYYPHTDPNKKEIKEELEKIGKSLFWDLNYQYDIKEEVKNEY